jgi:hypothetical protein
MQGALPVVSTSGACPYPYLIDYRVGENEIVVLRFRHSARRPLHP